MAATRTPPKASHQRAPRTRTRTRADRAHHVSEDVFTEVEAGQRAAIQAVKKFVDTVDHTLPPEGEEPSRRQTVVDAAMDMADRLVQVQYEFLRKVVRSAGKSLER